MKIIVFDKFLGYQVGGAQSSIHLLLENLMKDSQHQWELLGCNVKKSFSAQKYRLENWQVKRLEIKEISKWPYFEYWLNKGRIKKFIKKQKGDLLITQGKWGAIAARYFQGKTIYFIRDEYHFNQVPIFQKSLKKILKKIYLFSQFFFLNSFFRDNKMAMKRSLVIANSSYMSKYLDNLFSIKSEFIYTFMDIKSLTKEDIKFGENERYITSIGSELIKGIDIVKKIAKAMPEHKFMIVGRNFSEPRWEGNILYQPWSNNYFELYKKIKIWLVANIIHKAIPRVGRVGAEAMALGIPAISSQTNNVKDYLPDRLYISDREDISLWKEKILEVLDNYEEYTKDLKEESLKFDSSIQIENFKKIVKKRLEIEF